MSEEFSVFSNLLSSTTFTIPVLDDFNHMYIANSNGNTSCTQFGYVDYYQINRCTLGIEDQVVDSTKTLVKIVDLLGREIGVDGELSPNQPIIYIFSDGTTQRVLPINL